MLVPPDPSLPKDSYLYALSKLKGNDLVGLSGDALAIALGAAGGAAVSGTVAGVAGASTILGSSALGSALGGVFVTATPVGWVVGCAVAAGAVGYGVSRMIRSGQREDEKRKKLSKKIKSKMQIKDVDYFRDKQIDLADDFLKKLEETIERDLIDQDTSNRMLSAIQSKAMPINVALKRINGVLNALPKH